MPLRRTFLLLVPRLALWTRLIAIFAFILITSTTNRKGTNITGNKWFSIYSGADFITTDLTDLFTCLFCGIQLHKSRWSNPKNQHMTTLYTVSHGIIYSAWANYNHNRWNYDASTRLLTKLWEYESWIMLIKLYTGRTKLIYKQTWWKHHR